MSAPASAPRPAAQTPLLPVILTAFSMALCAWMCVDGVRLTRIGPPWAAAPPTLEPGLLAEPTSTGQVLAATPTPALAATLNPLLPTPTLVLTPAGALPAGALCAPDRVVIEGADPGSGATIRIGRDPLSVTVAFCLQSQPAARLLLAVVSSDAQPYTLPLGGPVILQQGDGRYTQSLNWGAAQWSPELAGEYRLVAAITAEGGGPVIVSAFGGQYTFVAP